MLTEVFLFQKTRRGERRTHALHHIGYIYGSLGGRRGEQIRIVLKKNPFLRNSPARRRGSAQKKTTGTPKNLIVLEATP